MKRSTVFVLASLTALGLVFIPSLIPTGPTSSLDASALLESGQLFVAAGVIFLGGLLTSLTPCVYPLIPITVGVFGARQAKSKGRALVLTSAYVVGMGAVFSALGVFAALSGRAFGSILGNTAVAVGLAGFMVALACSMFGAFELALPSGLATKLNGVGGGGVVGALLMGSVAGFLAAPCTGPVLTGVLAWVSQTRDPTLGAALLFVYAMGIGVPFFLIGVFTVRMPKGGAWMEWVKSIFGIALLAMAASYLRDAFSGFRNVIASGASLLGRSSTITVAAALAFAGVLLGAIHLSFKEGKVLHKGAGVAAVLVGFLLRMGVAGTTESSELAPTGAVAWELTFKAEQSKSPAPVDQVLAKAKADCKPVLVDFYADWCGACKELDQQTYVAPDVVAESRRFVMVKVDGTNDDDVLNEIYDRFGVQGLPTVAFVDPMGAVLQTPRVVGFLPPGKFLSELQKIGLATCSRTQ